MRVDDERSCSARHHQTERHTLAISSLIRSLFFRYVDLVMAPSTDDPPVVSKESVLRLWSAPQWRTRGVADDGAQLLRDDHWRRTVVSREHTPGTRGTSRWRTIAKSNALCQPPHVIPHQATWEQPQTRGSTSFLFADGTLGFEALSKWCILFLPCAGCHFTSIL